MREGREMMEEKGPVKFTIPRTPPYLNDYIRSHWAVKKELRRTWARDVFYALLAAGGERIVSMKDERPPKMRVHIKIFWQTRRTDPDSLVGCVKPILDGMRDALLIRNDSEAWLELEVEQDLDHEKPRTEFEFGRAETGR